MNPTRLFYPKWWLESINYFTLGSTAHDAQTNKELPFPKEAAGVYEAAIQFPASVHLSASGDTGTVTMSIATMFVCIFVLGGVCVMGGLVAGNRIAKRNKYEALA